MSSPITKRVYNLGLDEFFAWYGQEPRPGFTKTTALCERVVTAATETDLILVLAVRRAGLHAARYVLVTTRGPEVAGLRLVRLMVAAMDNLLRFRPRTPASGAERGGAGFNDFLLHFDSPVS